MVIKIKNLRLRTIIGCHDWERKNKQDIVINIEMLGFGGGFNEIYWVFYTHDQPD